MAPELPSSIARCESCSDSVGAHDLRASASVEDLPSALEAFAREPPASPRNFSSDKLEGVGAVRSEREGRLTRGRWHIVRVPEADHSLGTWASDKSDAMYRELFALLGTVE